MTERILALITVKLHNTAFTTRIPHGLLQPNPLFLSLQPLLNCWQVPTGSLQDFIISRMLCKQNHTIHNFGLGLFHTMKFSGDSRSRLLRVSLLYFFLLQSSTPWYGCTKVGLTSHPLRGFFSSSLVEIKLLQMYVYSFLCEYRF